MASQVLPNSDKRHPIAHPWEWAMRCVILLFLVWSSLYSFPGCAVCNIALWLRTSLPDPQYLWDVITCPCPWYLPMTYKSSTDPVITKANCINWYIKIIKHNSKNIPTYIIICSYIPTEIIPPAKAHPSVLFPTLSTLLISLIETYTLG